MSQVYSTEPQTTGRVVLQTSHGPIDINLWCKECPKACRSFLQLSMDGYYDGLPFHRVIKNYLLQTGDRASSLVEDDPSVRSKLSSYLHHVCHKIHETKGLTPSYRPELSSRIKFNHRGQVAMAQNISTTLTEADEGSSHLDGHFFITLDEAPHLNGQHVIFGTVTGPTIFNAIRASGVELVEGEDTPVDAATACFIERVDIKDHPFGNQLQTLRGVLPWVESLEGKKKETTQANMLAKRKKARKGKRDLNVLSFGHEEDDSSSIHIHNERKSLFEAQKPSTARRDSLKEEIDDTLLHVYNEDENCVICDVDEEEQKNIAHGSAEPEFKADGNEEAQVDDTIPTHQRFLEPHSQGNNTRNTDEQSSRHPKKSIVEERREKYKRLQKTAVDKKGKRQREENTIQRLLDFKSKLATEANQVRLPGNLAWYE
jgi:peptidyl-prolyl cis-trans isomerase SDCCAG10